MTGGASTLTALNLSLSSGGVVSGTPTTSGSASFTVQVTDSASHTASATLALTINDSLAIATTSLPIAVTSTAYTHTLSATGGSQTGYTWTVSGVNNLATFNLSLSAAGVLSGTPTSTGTANFTAQVTDSYGDTATMPLSVVVYDPLSLPAANPVSLPGTGTVNVAYTGTIVAAGGSGTYTWTVTGLSDGLTSTPVGATLTISGTPTSTATVTFNVKLTDTVTGTIVTQTGYSIVVSNPVVPTLPPANPSSLAAATINQFYTGSITVAGGTAPYSWTINGVAVTGGGLALSDGLSATNSGDNTLTVAGTPTTTGTVTLTSVQVTDSASGSAGPITYTITVNNPPSQVSGVISLNNSCGGGISTPPISISINTSPVQTTTTNGSGYYSFAAVPDGSYTITPSIIGASSVFFPATQNITVAGSSITSNFSATLGYSVSGSVTYTGADTGRVYLNLANSSCGGSGGEGTSIPFSAISSGGAFTINGVPPGNYTLQASLDNLGEGAPNATSPSASVPVSVTSANVTSVSITPLDPTLSDPTATPTLETINPIDSGVVINYKPISDSNGLGTVSFYTVQWSTDSAFSSPSSVTMKTVEKGGDVWFLNNDVAGINGTFTNGTPYYFRARGEVAGGAGPWAVWGGGTPLAVTVGAPTGFNTVSGAVTIPSDITPTGPLYVGFYDQSNNNVYATLIPLGSLSNTSPNAFTVNVPNGTKYFFFGILDQNADGLIDIGDVGNTAEHDTPAVVVSGNMTGQDLTLPDTNSTTSVATQEFSSTYWNGSSANTSSGYNLNFQVVQGNKLPVAVQLVAASNPNVITPVDVGSLCQGCGHLQFDYFTGIGSSVPVVGDTYTFNVTYSDSPTPVAVVATVTGVIAPNAAPSNLFAIGTLPIFSWYDWAPTAADDFRFYMWDSSGNTIWQIPSSNSNSNGFSSAILEIDYPTDPLGDLSNTPTIPVLTPGSVYNWSITATDSNGNQAQTSTYFIP